MFKQTYEDIEHLTHDVEAGVMDPIKAYVAIYQLEKVIAEAKKALQVEAIAKREQYDAKEQIAVDGYKVSVVSTTRYSYNDPEIDRLQALVKSRQDLAKQAFAIEQKGGIFSDANGEVVPAAIPSYSAALKLELIK